MASVTGPTSARLYLRLLSLVSLLAWLSLGSQLLLLIGEGGLLPIAPLLEEARRQGVSALEVPTLLWLWSSDRAIVFAVASGGAASLYGVLRPGRVGIAISLPLYLSVSVAAQDFCAFQWDFLLVEASFVSLFLDWRRPTRAALLLPRLLLVKLYVESGLAKLGSPLGDWLSGSAMSAYFETAPLPTPLARSFHALPIGLLHASSWAVLFVELVVPWLAFGPRPARRASFIALTGFQLVNLLSANYGFFVPLSLCLHVLLLDDETWAKLRLGRIVEPTPPPRGASATTALVLALWSFFSLRDGIEHLWRSPPAWASAIVERTEPAHARYDSLRIVGTYHLFASVTTERIEPIFELRLGEEDSWIELAMRYKPGPVDRPPPFVAPHQPRVDFQLWFHGLHARGRLPGYALRIEELLCADPTRVAALFSTPITGHPRAVRIGYARYRFAPSGDANTWRREPLFLRPELRCDEGQEKSARLSEK